MRFEETVEERDVVKSQREGYLFYLQIGYFELRLGISQDGIIDNVARRPVTHLTDSGTQVRQRDTHRLRILIDVVPLVVVLYDQLAVVVVYLRLAVNRTGFHIVLLTRHTGITGLEQIEDMHHLLRIEHRGLRVKCLYQRVVHAA